MTPSPIVSERDRPPLDDNDRSEVSPGARPTGLISILSQRAVFTVLIVVLVMMSGLGMVFPIVPLYARSFDVSLVAVGAFISAFGVTRLVFDLVGGVFVDRWGERSVTVGGLATMAIASVVTGLAGSFGLAASMWALGGAGSAVAFGGLYSYLLKVVPKEQMARTLGLFYGAFNVGIIGGSPIGGFVAHRFGLRGPFLAYGAVLAASALLYFLLIDASPQHAPATQEARADAPRRGPLGGLGPLLENRGFLAACAGNLAYLWMVAAVFETLVPLMAREQLGMSTSSIGLLFAVGTAAELAALYPAGAWADRRGRRAVLIPALAALAVMTVVVGWSSGPVVLGVTLGVLGLTSGVAGVPPAAMLSDVTPSERSGTAVGVFRFCGDLGFVFGPAVAGAAAAGLGFPLAFAISAAPTAAALIVAAWAPETLGVRPTAEAA